jgi:hypothetical protein
VANQILDIHPGYLGNQHIADEYCFLQTVLTGHSDRATRASAKQGLQQWPKYSWAAYHRYCWLEAELNFRGIVQQPPQTKFEKIGNENLWPESSCTPAQQFKVISEMRIHADTARLPIPKNAQQVWAQHKYSIMARNNNLYREMGQKVAGLKTELEFADLLDELTYILRLQPSEGGLRNAAQHMWGHVSGNEKVDKDFVDWPLSRLLREIIFRVIDQEETYLLHSTALTELQTWLHD